MTWLRLGTETVVVVDVVVEVLVAAVEGDVTGLLVSEAVGLVEDGCEGEKGF